MESLPAALCPIAAGDGSPSTWERTTTLGQQGPGRFHARPAHLRRGVESTDLELGTLSYRKDAFRTCGSDGVLRSDRAKLTK